MNKEMHVSPASLAYYEQSTTTCRFISMKAVLQNIPIIRVCSPLHVNKRALNCSRLPEEK